jgi:hypothetical protein
LRTLLVYIKHRLIVFLKLLEMLSFDLVNTASIQDESPSLVLVINDTKLLMPCVKCFELGISNTCDEGVRGKEWWPQDHKEMVHGHDSRLAHEPTSGCIATTRSSLPGSK